MELQDNLINIGEREKIIEAIIPEISCPDNCYKCCNENLGWYMHYDTGEAELRFDASGCFSTQCFRFTGSGCSIFSQRPWICRLFFKSEDQPPCFLGLLPKRVFSREEFRRLVWCIHEGTILDAYALRAYLKE